MTESNLEELIDIALLQMLDFNLAVCTMDDYRYCFKRMIRFAADNNIENYPHSIFVNFILDLESLHKDNLLDRRKLSKFKKCFQFLDALSNRQSLSWSVEYQEKHPLTTTLYASVIMEYKNQNLGLLAPSTIARRIGVGKMLFRFAESSKIFCFTDWNLDFLNSFINHMMEKQPKSIRCNLTSLRSIFSFLMDKELIESSFMNVLYFHSPIHRRVKKYFTLDQVSKILSVIDISTIHGKRNHAMITLAMYTGLSI